MERAKKGCQLREKERRFTFASIATPEDENDANDASALRHGTSPPALRARSPPALHDVTKRG